MNPLAGNSYNLPKKKDGFRSAAGNGAKTKSLSADASSCTKSRECSSSVLSRQNLTEKEASAKGSSSPAPLGWPIRKAIVTKCAKSNENENDHGSLCDDLKFSKMISKISEIDMMKERFAKLLLGEDMSGSGKGVGTALAISNAITNLCATIFGRLWRLEPLPSGKKEKWRRDIDWLLCVSDHIIELVPSWQTFPDGNKLEVMTCRPRLDIFINLPALRKLDNLLIEILDSFTATEFWYVDQGIVAPDANGSSSFCRTIQRQEEKWWLPVPRLPSSGLSESSRKKLNHTRESANQILKAAMVINSVTLAEMEVPESYMEALPKNGRACLGDVIYRYVTSDQFSPECLLDFLDLSSEYVTLDIANRVEAAIYVWRRRAHSRTPPNPNHSTAKSSWEMVKDLMVDGDKREFLAERAESLLLCLKQRFPCLTQTSLDTSKIQCNEDIGKSILESYSRVLESMAFNITSRIDDLLYVDDLTKRSDRLSSVSTVSVTSSQKFTNSISFSVSVLGTPSKQECLTPKVSPTARITSAKGERTILNKKKKDITISEPHCRGSGVKRVLTKYLVVDTTPKIRSNPTECNQFS